MIFASAYLTLSATVPLATTMALMDVSVRITRSGCNSTLPLKDTPGLISRLMARFIFASASSSLSPTYHLAFAAMSCRRVECLSQSATLPRKLVCLYRIVEVLNIDGARWRRRKRAFHTGRPCPRTSP